MIGPGEMFLTGAAHWLHTAKRCIDENLDGIYRDVYGLAEEHKGRAGELVARYARIGVIITEERLSSLHKPFRRPVNKLMVAVHG